MTAGGILIIEDEFAIAQDLSETLTGAGHKVCGVAAAPRAARALAEEHRPELALVDVRLGEGGDGLEVARDLRDRLHIPSILITGHLTDATAVSAGVLGYLAKPFGKEEALDVVRAGLKWIRDGHARNAPEALIPTRSRPVPNQVRLLLVDDNARIGGEAKASLGKSGIQVSAVTSGADAVRLYCRPKAFDLVLLDIFMPDKDGLETLRELRRIDPEVRVIAMAEPGESGGVDYLRIARIFGAQGSIWKPFTGQALQDAISTLVQGRRAELTCTDQAV